VRPVPTGEDCPVGLDEVDAEYAVQRIENLVGAWHQQLIEVLGAMGIREVRRLRGETGRRCFRGPRTRLVRPIVRKAKGLFSGRRHVDLRGDIGRRAGGR